MKKNSCIFVPDRLLSREILWWWGFLHFFTNNKSKIVKTRQLYVGLLFLFMAGNVPEQATAQIIQEFNRHSYRINAGVLTHFGDIKQNAIWPERDEMKMAGSVNLEYHLSPVMSINSGFMYGTLGGMRDHASFETRLVEFSLSGVVRFNQLLFPHAAINNRISVYGFGGIGFLDYDAGYYEYGILSDVAEGYAFIVPIGAGIAFRLGQRVDMYIESASRITGNDWIDAYIGSPDPKDVYNFTSIGLAFRLGSNTRGRNWSSRSVVHEHVAPTPPPPPPPPPPVHRQPQPEPQAAQVEEEKEVLKSESFEVEPPLEQTHRELVDHEKNDYFVILGSFGYRNNADSFMESLRRKGFNPMILRSETGLFRVSVDSFYNRADATQRLQQIRSHFPEHQDAWLLIRKR
jgi:hypothetical protein